MARAYIPPGRNRPITNRGRLVLAAAFLLAAVVLGFAISLALYQANREAMRSSEVLGYLLCGEGQFVDDTEDKPGTRRMICRDASGAEVGDGNNFIAVSMALPFIILLAGPAVLLAFRIGTRKGRML